MYNIPLLEILMYINIYIFYSINIYFNYVIFCLILRVLMIALEAVFIHFKGFIMLVCVFWAKGAY